MKLDECKILNSEVGYGTIGLNYNPGYDIIISVNNNTIENYLSAHPNSILEFEIPNGAKYFSCKIALNDSSDLNTSANFEIKVDGETSFLSKNIKKNKIQNVEIFLNNNHKIELICTFNENPICHALWIEPKIEFELPKYSICSFNTTLIENSTILKEKTELCISSFFDENNFKYFENLYYQIKRYTNEKIKFVIFCEEWIDELLKFDDVHVIKIKDKSGVRISSKKTGFLNKSSLYSVAKYVNSNKYLLIDVDIICTGDILNIFDQIKNSDTLYVTRDAHTEGLSFGDIISESWSAYEGSPKCKEILCLSPQEINDEFIMNSGVIAGSRSALLSFESELKKILPLSEFYFNENESNGLREQAVANLAVIRHKDYEILHKQYNLQVLWEEVDIFQKNGRLTSISNNFSPLFVHFNGPAAKNDLKNIIDYLKSNQDFSFQKTKFGRTMNDFFKNEKLNILDLQTNETICESFKNTTNKEYYICKLTNKSKKITTENSYIEQRVEDLYHELKKIINKESFDVTFISNLDNYHNILTKLIMSLRCSKYICFNEYNYGDIKIEDILEYLNSGEANLVYTHEENPNQKIYILENSWN